MHVQSGEVAAVGTRRVLGILAAALIGFAASGAAAQVRWRSGTSAHSGNTPVEAVQTIAGAGSRGAARHLLVQFDEPMTDARRAELQAAGVELLSYLSDYAFFAAVAPGGADATALAQLASLSDARAIQVDWKLHPMLAQGVVPEWAVVGRTEAGDTGSSEEIVGAYVVFHRDVPLDPDGVDVCLWHDAVVRSHVESVHCLVVELPYSRIAALADEDAVQWIEPPLPRMSEVNDSNRARTEADTVQAPPYNLDGSGVTVLVYDGGYARASHVDFQGRLTVRDSSGMSSHATWVCGTVGGAGVANPTYRGMAPGVIIESYGFEYDGSDILLYSNPGDIEDDYDEAIDSYGADIANNSIGSNTAPNGFPCDITGDYGITSQLIDTIVRGDGSNPLFDAPFRVVWANGNERATARCGDTYYTTAPPACAKNHITVGALNSNDDSVTYFTSWGPADDGRLKPDISGPGCQNSDDGGVTSTSDANDTAYGTYCGTSAACATVSGLLSLLLQDYRAQFPAQPDPRNSTLKILLAHRAVDLGNTGPDYQYGYGSVRIQRSIDFMRTANFDENQVGQGGTVAYHVSITGGSDLKVTLAWDDTPGTPNVVPALVNDLDLRVFAPGDPPPQHFPWTLEPANPGDAAVRTEEDHVNNIEQVYVGSPEAGTWTIEVHGYSVPNGPQPFSLCASPNLSSGPPPTCDDGVQNQGEDRIDCGGPCPTCNCLADGDCLFCNGETCDVYGECQPGTEVDCSDPFDCTVDTCNEDTDQCDHTIAAGSCLIGGQCHDGGDANPGNDCQECDPSADQTNWSFKSPGAACGDPTDDECTAPDTCDGTGVCLDNHASGGTSCNDGLFCNGADACSGGTCSRHGGYPCGGNEWCDDSVDVCVGYGDGDFEPDSDVDLADFVQFQLCFDLEIAAGSVCEPANITGMDGKIDLDDYAAFHAVFTGPLGP